MPSSITFSRGHLDRSNLAVEVENRTSTTWDIDYYVNHGDISAFCGNSRVHAVNPSRDNPKPKIFEVGLEAAGAGGNIGLVITSSKKTEFVLIAATPSNKTNYTKHYHSTKYQSSAEDYWDEADDQDKHYSSHGFSSMSADGITVKAMITGTSPATAFIELIES